MTGNAMGGSRSSGHPETVTAEEVTMPGRHRARGGPGVDTWIPAVPADAAGHHRHRPGATPPPPRHPAFTPAQGTLPVPQAESWLPQPTRLQQERGAFEPPRRGRIDLPQPTRNRLGGAAAARSNNRSDTAAAGAGDRGCGHPRSETVASPDDLGTTTPGDRSPSDVGDGHAAGGTSTEQPERDARGASAGGATASGRAPKIDGRGFAPNSGDLGTVAGAGSWPESKAEGAVGRSVDLATPVEPVAAAPVAAGTGRVANGSTVVPDWQPVSEVDRAWAPPGTTRSLADMRFAQAAKPPVQPAAETPMRPRPDKQTAHASAEEHVAGSQAQVRRTRRERVEATAATLAGSGRLPAAAREGRNEVPRRQRVSLRAPAVKKPEPEDEEEVRVYAAPLLDGLGKFDLGSVPASVTPPKTWRKAAWFATGASGAVVVGLLFAGTFLVGGPTTTTDALGGGWPGRQNGGNPLVLDPSLGQHSDSGDSRSDSNSDGNHPSRDTDSADSDTHPQNAAASPSSDEQMPTDPSSSSSSGPITTEPITTGPTSSTSPPSTPEKPPITPAQRETSPTSVLYTSPKDAQKMGDNSETFFNTVTTDPQEASSVTTGDLKSEGPQRLRQRYADVAYFEVKKVQIDPDSNTTVNTLEVTHTDGTKTVEQRTLTFGDDEKIADDGS